MRIDGEKHVARIYSTSTLTRYLTGITRAKRLRFLYKQIKFYF
ncbi:hypothetical protein [Campylobacter sp.]|nr:hypothetical protein [Campylobacter sp.]